MGLLVFPYSLTAHTDAKAAEVMADLNAIATVLNGGVDSKNIAEGGVEAKNLAKGAIDDLAISGAVKANGEKLSGSGFTSSRLAAGKYKVVLAEEQATALNVIVQQAYYPFLGSSVLEPNVGKKEFIVYTFNLVGELGDRDFHFWAKPS